MFDVFLRAMQDQPDDDLVRLACADWLEEQGNSEQARFVRLQVEQARAPAESQAACRLGHEAEALLAEHERAWLGHWSERLVHWSFRRGFLDSVTIEPEVFLAFGQELFSGHPVRELRFVTGDGQPCDGEVAEELTAAPALRHARALDVSGCVPSAGPGWCRALAGADQVCRLEELNLGSGYHPGAAFHDPEALLELCLAGHLRSLRKLDLSAPLDLEALGDASLSPLLLASFASHLTTLDLSGWQLSDTGARVLAHSRQLRGLRELNLSWCEGLSRQGIQAVLDSPYFEQMSGLGLGGDIDLYALAAAPRLGQLERLDVCTSPARYPRLLTADGWAHLARSPHVARLRRLSLLHNLLDEDGAAALLLTPGPLRLWSLMVYGLTGDPMGFAELAARSAALAELTVMELMACGIDGAGMQALMKAAFVPRLRVLCLAGNRIQARGLRAVLGSPLTTGALGEIHLHHCELPHGVLRQLWRWPGLAGVVRLELGSNHIDLQAMAALARSPYLGRLTALHLGPGNFTPEALLALTAPGALPRLRELSLSPATPPEVVAALRGRFGARLRLDARS